MKRLLLALLFLPALTLAQTPTTANVVVRWDAVTQCTSGTSIVTCSNPVTYNVYIGTNGSGSEGKPALQQNLATTIATLLGYNIGATVYIYVTAVSGGVEGAPSAEVSYVVATAQQTPLQVLGVGVAPQ
jgi:hypothetical protein